MAVTDWIDELTKIWAFQVADGAGFKTVRSYRVYTTPVDRDNAFPESLSVFPCALTFINPGVRLEYSAGGPQLAFWQGRTEFHCVGSSDKVHLPFVMRFFEPIYKAAAQNFQLSGRVRAFYLEQTEGALSIQGPLELQYGSEEPHLGLIAYWHIKENISNEFTFKA